MVTQRCSGILAHMSSLPSPFGIGDVGYSSYKFIDFLVKGGQSYWQFLPTGPTNAIFDHSPYMSSSAFAGSYLLISPELLVEDGLLSENEITNHREFSPYTTRFKEVTPFKKQLLLTAFERFSPTDFPGYHDFVCNSHWLDNYSLFMAIKATYNDSGWYEWPSEFATRNQDALNAFAKTNKRAIEFHKFEQFIFFRQWQALKQYASSNNIILFGDLPIYVSYDSVDVWAHREIFCIDHSTLKPTHVAGVPPDYFSATGQRWGNPLYDWQNTNPTVQEHLLCWWIDRFDHLFNMVDSARIDHFRGLESYWSIPESQPTAMEGEWLKGPGKPFFDKIAAKLGKLDIVAEDLGIITKEVEKLRDELNYPGMKVLQFAFDGNLDNSFLPHNFTTTNCVIYTGTHDNDTTVGWYLSDKLDETERKKVKESVNSGLHNSQAIHLDLIYLAMSSIAKLAIFPLQDILGFGNDCKMNSPGVAEGNWRWRCSPDFLTAEIISQLKATTQRFNRENRLNRS